MRENELPKCLKGVEVSGEAGGGDFDSVVRCDGEGVAFLRDFRCRSRAQYDRECLRRWAGSCEGESCGGSDVFEFCGKVVRAFPAGKLAGFKEQGGECAGVWLPFDVGRVGQEGYFSRSCGDSGWCDGCGVLRFGSRHVRGER